MSRNTGTGEKMRKDSRIPGFYKLGVEKRISTVKETSGLSNEDVKVLTGTMSKRSELQRTSMVSMIKMERS